MGYCDRCGTMCQDCETEDKRQDAPFGMLDADWDAMFKSWSWNLGSVEAAHELRQKAGEWYGPDFYMHVDEEDLEARIAKFFDEKTASATMDAWHGLEAIGV